MLGWVTFGLIIAGTLWWMMATESGRRYSAAAEARRAAKSESRAKPSSFGHRTALSNVGDVSTGTLACPKCKGTQFKAKRSGVGKVAAGVLAPKTRVKCTTCGTEYKRK